MALRRGTRGQRGHELFPEFTDVQEIGVGSLAVVFRAREIGTGRLVALKLLNVRDASPRSIESFERESIALGALSSHPNIVTLYRTFRTPDGRPVLVLELCSGAVADRLRDGAGLPVAEVVSIGVKIAGALETAHRGGILHRDVKPQNILVTEFGEPALADFGVAMLQSSTQTTAGLFDFTTLHAAPELLEGAGTSAATDVYELASSLYQLIAGRSAFRAYDGEAPASVILRILRDPVRPLSGVEVPMALSDLLIRAMSKQMDDRPPTAVEFAAELADVEIAEGWNRTQFLIRDSAAADAGPGRSTAPEVTRMPDEAPRGLPSTLLTPGRPAAAMASAPPMAPSMAPPAAPPISARVAPVAPTPPPPRITPPPTMAPTPNTSSTEWSAPTISTPGGWTPPPPDAVVSEPPLAPPAWSAPAVAPAAPPEREPEVAAEPEPEPTVAPEPEPSADGPEPSADEAAPEQLAPRDWAGLAPPAVPAEPVPAPPAEPTAPVPPAPPVPPEPASPPSATPPPELAPLTGLTASGAFPLPEPATSDSGAVPVWAVRAPVPSAAPVATGPQFSSDLSLDPMSLRPRAALRAGASSVIVDDRQLKLRTWFKRSSIPWSDVLGFQAQLDESDGAPAERGQIVALTTLGPVEMPGTRRPLGELRYVHALLDAYRVRALRIAAQ